MVYFDEFVFVSTFQNSNLHNDCHEDVGEGCKDAGGVEVVLQHVAHEHRQAGDDHDDDDVLQHTMNNDNHEHDTEHDEQCHLVRRV